VLRHGRYSSLNESRSSFLPVLPQRKARDRGLSSIGSFISCLELIKTNTRPARVPRPPLVVYPSENISEQMNRLADSNSCYNDTAASCLPSRGDRAVLDRSLDRATSLFHSALFISGHLVRYYNAFDSIDARGSSLDFAEPSSEACLAETFECISCLIRENDTNFIRGIEKWSQNR